MVDYNGTLIITKIQNVVTIDTVVIQYCFYGFYCVTIEGLEFFNKNLLACLQEVTSSLRLFSVPRWGLQIIKYFSHRHKLHLLEQGLYDTACFKIFQVIRKLMLLLMLMLMSFFCYCLSFSAAPVV